MKHVNLILLLNLLVLGSCSKPLVEDAPPMVGLTPIQKIARIMVDDTKINPITYWWVDENGQKLEFDAIDGLEIIGATEDKSAVLISPDSKTLAGEHVDYTIDGDGSLTITIKPCGAEEMHYYDFTLLYNKDEYRYRISQSSRANQDKLAELLRKNPLEGGHVFN